MKLTNLLLLAAPLVCSAGAHESASSRSDKQTLVAHRMGTPPTSNSAKINPAPPETNSNKVPENVEANDAEDPDESPSLERQPVEARVVLSNVEITDLSAEETMYFESSLRKAIQIAQDEEEQDSGEDEVTIGAILVENGHGAHKDNNNRALRGGRELGFSSWFNIWAVIETFRCRFCIDYDDDDTDHYEEWKKARPTPAPTRAPTSSPTYEVDDQLIAWYNERLAGGGRRHLGVSESNTSLDDILCQLLREGPYECFHSVTECSLVVSKW